MSIYVKTNRLVYRIHDTALMLLMVNHFELIKYDITISFKIEMVEGKGKG